jgi:multicomponent K+:H+ antiporter subunit F
VNSLALLVVLGLWLADKSYFEVALLIGLLGFVGTVVLGKFIVRGDIVE